MRLQLLAGLLQVLHCYAAKTQCFSAVSTQPRPAIKRSRLGAIVWVRRAFVALQCSRRDEEPLVTADPFYPSHRVGTPACGISLQHARIRLQQSPILARKISSNLQCARSHVTGAAQAESVQARPYAAINGYGKVALDTHVHPAALVCRCACRCLCLPLHPAHNTRAPSLQ